MSNQSGKQLSFKNISSTEFKDVHGNTIWELSASEETTKDKGTGIHRKTKETLQTVDGIVLTKDMTSKIQIGVCQQCREGSFFDPQTHGFVTLKNARLCDKCGTMCCPAHIKKGSDGKHRCIRHHRSLWSLFRPLLFEAKEE